MQNLAAKYRPQTFDTILGQESVKKILKKQLETGNITNCYLFSGPSGTGKTTLARAFTKLLNNTQGNPIEIDAASNNGVDNVRDIIDNAAERSVDSKYKVYIVDEVQSLTGAAWNAFLKLLEEPPTYTVFMFCTTNPEKIPETILNRLMRFNLSKIPTNLIYQRLLQICQQEGFSNYQDSCDYISKLADGCARQAIALLEKAANYDTNLDINTVLECLGNFSYQSFFDFTDALVDGREADVIQIIENYYNAGNDLKIFVEQYLDFALDLEKYCLFKDLSCTKIPLALKSKVDYSVGFNEAQKYFNDLLDKVLNIKNAIKYDINYELTVEISFIKICRGM